MEPVSHIERPTDADRAASSIIGVSVMVAVTVIIAVVLGTVVFGIGSELNQPPPVATFSAKAQDGGNTIEVTHEKGEALVANEVLVVASNGVGRVGFTSKDAGQLYPDDTFTIKTVSPGPKLTNWPDAQFTERTGSGFDIKEGDEVTVLIIDAKGRHLVFETTVVAD